MGRVLVQQWVSVDGMVAGPNGETDIFDAVPDFSASDRHIVSTSASEVLPYVSGLRVPSRFRLGPLSTSTDVMASLRCRGEKEAAGPTRVDPAAGVRGARCLDQLTEARMRSYSSRGTSGALSLPRSLRCTR